MIYYKDGNNKIYAYEDNVDKKYIKDNLIAITETEYKSFKLFGVFDKTEDEIQIQIQINDLEKAKIDKITELYKTYNSKLSEDIAYMDTNFQCDKYSRDLIASTLSAGSVPDGFYWLDVNNDKVSMAYTDLQGLSATILARGQGLFDTLQDYKNQVNACTSIDEVNSIVWS